MDCEGIFHIFEIGLEGKGNTLKTLVNSSGIKMSNQSLNNKLYIGKWAWQSCHWMRHFGRNNGCWLHYHISLWVGKHSNWKCNLKSTSLHVNGKWCHPSVEPICLISLALSHSWYKILIGSLLVNVSIEVYNICI